MPLICFEKLEPPTNQAGPNKLSRQVNANKAKEGKRGPKTPREKYLAKYKAKSKGQLDSKPIPWFHAPGGTGGYP